MGKIVIVDNLKKFVQENSVAMDRALNRMAIDIERLSKEKVPLLQGLLRASGYHVRRGVMLYTVGFNKVYAAYQEWGGDGKGKVVRNYSKAGTGKFYLRDSARKIVEGLMRYLKSETDKIKV